MNVPSITRSLDDLARAGFDVAALRAELAVRLANEARERAVPNEDDTRWPLVAPCSIEEHLSRKSVVKVTENGNVQSKPTGVEFSCAIAPGREYVLTRAQRDVLRQWFNIIPSPTIEVVDITLFPDSAIAYAREVIIRTTAFRPKGSVVNGPRTVSITKFGTFMSACRAREVELAQQAEVDKLLARVWRLLDRAKEANVAYRIAAGTVAHEWHAFLEVNKIVDDTARRDALRDILVAKGEHGLAKLVREPTMFAVSAREDEVAALCKALGV